jgi:cytochrome c oxidase subunit 3
MDGATRIDITAWPLHGSAIDARAAAQRQQVRELGLWMFLATVAMLFAAFTSAVIVRRGGSDWRPVVLPSVLWLNTAVLAASSVAIEIGRLAGRKGSWTRARAWVAGALTLGVLFLAGQIAAWQDLWARGVYLPGNAYSSFFYVLTGVHGCHLTAGLLLLGCAVARLGAPRGGHDGRPGLLTLGATFWHFFGGLWIYMLAVLALS